MSLPAAGTIDCLVAPRRGAAACAPNTVSAIPEGPPSVAVAGKNEPRDPEARAAGEWTAGNREP